VRRLGEFLRETDGSDCVGLPDFRFSQQHEVRTRGLGFSCADDGGPSARGAEALGQSTQALLSEIGVEAEAVAALARAGVVRSVPAAPSASVAGEAAVIA
jgi:hypothetical protein